MENDVIGQRLNFSDNLKESNLDLILVFGLGSRTIQSHKGSAVFLAQNPHKGGKPLTGIASTDPIS